MLNIPRPLSAAAVLLIGSISTGFAQNDPLFTVDVHSYEKLLSDAGKIASAAGQDASMVEMQMQIMIGPGVLGLVDATKPWHAAVWMESLAATPVIAVVLPVSDFEGFQTAFQATMLGQLGAQLVDLDGAVAVFGSSPGAPVPDGWSERVAAYASDLKVTPEETVEITIELSDEIRQAVIASLAIPRAQMMAAFEQPDVDTAGVSPEAMKGMMESYFSFYETMLKETSRFDLGFGVDGKDLDFVISMLPVDGSGLADLVTSQNVDITDLAKSVNWDSGMSMILGMNDLPESWKPLMDSSMKSLMPIYGLDDEASEKWVEAMQLTLPFKGLYNVSFEDGMSFSGYYDILDAPAQEVYDLWLSIIKGITEVDDPTTAYYSEINIEKGHRVINEHSVDRIELVLNPEHPTMQLDGQKELMEKMFKDGKFVYEMAVVGSRIYISGEGELEQVMLPKSNGKVPAGVGPNTRFYGTMDFLEFFKLGAGFTDEAMPASIAALEKGEVVFTYLIETDEALTLKSSFPLGLIEAFSAAE